VIQCSADLRRSERLRQFPSLEAACEREPDVVKLLEAVARLDGTIDRWEMPDDAVVLSDCPLTGSVPKFADSYRCDCVGLQWDLSNFRSLGWQFLEVFFLERQ
jgi:hypothetical protein